MKTNTNSKPWFISLGAPATAPEMHITDNQTSAGHSFKVELSRSASLKGHKMWF